MDGRILLVVGAAIVAGIWALGSGTVGPAGSDSEETASAGPASAEPAKVMRSSDAVDRSGAKRLRVASTPEGEDTPGAAVGRIETSGGGFGKRVAVQAAPEDAAR